jgi:hypothetical protein
MTLFLAATQDQGILYIPNYSVVVSTAGTLRRMYHGSLQEFGEPISLQGIIKKYCEGDIFGLLFPMTWGGFDSRDSDILEDLGLTYRSFRCDMDGDARIHYIWRDDRWRETPLYNPLAVFEFLNKHSVLTKDIVQEIGSRWSHGAFSDDRSSVFELDDIAQEGEGKKRNIRWIGDVDRCDLCNHDLANDRYMIDGQTTAGFWANMCSRCFKEHGKQIAWGYGQLYQREDKNWLQVGGFDPEWPRDDDY